MSAETVEVPFITVGNRRCLTMWQIHEKPWLGAFLRRHQDSFKFDPHLLVWWYHD